MTNTRDSQESVSESPECRVVTSPREIIAQCFRGECTADCTCPRVARYRE